MHSIVDILQTSLLLLRRRCNGYLGVRSAVVHVIASVEADKTLKKQVGMTCPSSSKDSDGLMKGRVVRAIRQVGFSGSIRS